jgi:ABC-2 type transport system ATP-binding protein
MTAPILEVTDLVKHFRKTAALSGVSFSVEQAEMFGLLGPNGAGKTTLLSIVSGLLGATSGRVSIQGRDALPMPKELRRKIGLVPQELALYAELTGRENLEFFGALYGLKGHVLRKRVDEVLAAVGLSDRAEFRVETYSGGMKRRLNLGAALVHRPMLLLLDEPTTGVDPQSRNHLFQEIRRVNALGTTVVYTSHYMEEVQALCPRVGIVDHGQLIACAQVSALLRQLNGFIRFRVPEVTEALRARVSTLAAGPLVEADGQGIELECQDVKSALIRLVALLNEMHVELISLETQEPNLEHVFLHLTGRALRD